MKRAGLLAVLLPWIAAASTTYEASANFDAENVVPFLHLVAHLFQSGFTDKEIENLTQFALQTKPEEERERQIPVTYRGKKLDLVFHVFMDDLDAPDIYFFSADQSLAEALQKEMASFSEGLGQ